PMAINTNSPSGNPQLNGILASVPTIAPTPRPPSSSIVGGVDPMTGAVFSVPGAAPSAAGSLVVGGGSTPAAGAQPAAPLGVTGLTTTIVPTTTAPVTTPATTTTTASTEASGAT